MGSSISVSSRSGVPVEMTSGDKFLLAIDKNPWSLIWRAIAGYLTAIVATQLQFRYQSKWACLAITCLALLILRMAGVLLRRIVPASPVVQVIWAKRRGIGKYYDSFQWRKLFGFGCGLALHATIVRASVMESAVAVLCILSGAVGIIRWHLIQRDRRLQIQ
jgi:hypothetical protein